MNRTIVFSALLLAFTTIAAVSAEPNGILSAKGPLALKLEEAPLLLKPCWGGGPIPEGPVWLPSAVEVATLETRLEEYMATVKLGERGMPEAGVQYRGQYVGFMRSKVKYIYASYVRADVAEKIDLSKGNAIIICDGGPMSWVIVYNTATGQFSELMVGSRFGGR